MPILPCNMPIDWFAQSLIFNLLYTLFEYFIVLSSDKASWLSTLIELKIIQVHVIKYWVDPWIPSDFPPLISHRFILLLSIVVSILSCSICGWKKKLFFIYYLIINVLSFYISVYYYLWVDLGLTEILLLVKNLH